MVFIGQHLLSHNNLTTKNIISSIVIGLVCAALSPFLFVWLMSRFANSKAIWKVIKIDIEADETILFETGANHFKGIEAVGGKLYLTNKRLVFKSHKLNIQNHERSINLSDIHKVERYQTLGLANNGVSVTTSEKRIEKFVVHQPEEWMQELDGKYSIQ